ncbi:hypothetical protein SARC_14846 [Sphaeroforma arctica JP610]|uniref:Uncharacterized protein n=1 Tax=Sphaeroforma arctica JP610 TaxID=667725 RepID=A0A0L0F7H4_9EUKA|nr:hypothetical protein SARC_14846 [Sphaeroforma arctica JP610]KNC72599.1 hypothetical protein SARC_14846 [Sphaeroforma arctica JP610]|eukprot:XP_014146501.1 hypothetical protein SARC_14846 [Sphaeroforma arctica JP610]
MLSHMRVCGICAHTQFLDSTHRSAPALADRYPLHSHARTKQPVQDLLLLLSIFFWALGWRDHFDEVTGPVVLGCFPPHLPTHSALCTQLTGHTAWSNVSVVSCGSSGGRLPHILAAAGLHNTQQQAYIMYDVYHAPCTVAVVA